VERLWVYTSKESIKAAFRERAEIKILPARNRYRRVLNLQTRGVLINYDMPNLTRGAADRPH
jgi:hypothetical protein